MSAKRELKRDTVARLNANGYRPTEIATMLGIRPASVYQHLFHIRSAERQPGAVAPPVVEVQHAPNPMSTPEGIKAWWAARR